MASNCEYNYRLLQILEYHRFYHLFTILFRVSLDEVISSDNGMAYVTHIGETFLDNVTFNPFSILAT